MNYTIREIKETEYALLDDFLYEAIFIPEGVEAPPKSIIDTPELQVYVLGFGKQKDDRALVAEVDGKIAGAVWVRIMNDYGHVDDETPSFAISLYKEFRGQGIGTALLTRMLDVLRENGYKRASLAVQKANYAVNMYRKAGFQIVDENEEEYIMVKSFNEDPIVTTILIDMYGVILEESKGNFIPYTFTHFNPSEHERLIRQFKEDRLFTKASNGEITSDEFLSLLGYENPQYHMKDKIQKF